MEKDILRTACCHKGSALLWQHVQRQYCFECPVPAPMMGNCGSQTSGHALHMVMRPTGHCCLLPVFELMYISARTVPSRSALGVPHSLLIHPLARSASRLQEGGERKQALVKIRVCPACAFKLNYRKEKQLQKVVQPSAARKRKHELEVDAWASQDPLVQEALDYVQCYAPGGSHSDVAGDGINGADLERAARDVAPPSAVANAVTTVAPTADAGSAQADGGGSGSGPKGVITLPADNSVWESKPAQEIANVEEEMDAYFEGLFL